MSVSLRVAGTWARLAADGTVAIPATPQAGDRMFLFATWKDFSITVGTISGWTAIGTEFADGTTAAGNGTGSVKVMAWYRDWQSGDTDPTIDWSANPTEGHAVIVVFQKSASETWDTPLTVTGAMTNWTTTSQTFSASATVAVPSGGVVMGLVGIRDDSSTMTRPTNGIDDASSAVTWNGNYVESPATHFSSTTGLDMSGDLGYRLVTTGATATLRMTGTISAAETGAGKWVVQGVSEILTAASDSYTLTGTLAFLEAGRVAHRLPAAVQNESAATTTCTVTIPASVQTGDVLFLAVTSRDSVGAGTLGVTDDDSGGNSWAKIANDTNHLGTLWYKRATSGTASKTITVANAVGSVSAVLKTFYGADPGATPYTNVTVETNTSGDETASGITPDNAGSMLCVAICHDNNNPTSAFTSANRGDFNPTESSTTGGSDCQTTFGHIAGVPASATGNTTWSVNPDMVSVTITWAIKPPANKVLSAAAGSHSLTGTAASLEYNRKFAVDAGSYTWTGTAASLEFGREVAAGAGSFSLTGTAASLEFNRLLAAAGATFTLTGTAASLEFGGEVAAASGAYSLTGTAASLEYGRELAAAGTSYSLTGTAAALFKGRTLAAEGGVFALAGGDAALAVGGTPVVPATDDGDGPASWAFWPPPHRRKRKRPEEEQEKEEEDILLVLAAMAERDW